ncbi:YqcI/YcgG family protein [Marivirga salinae]|uniref:YqcI/YcgG family protein n=1 Tax=Marivirga salinarum TaxID=3059078 RepID=A0AA49GAE1_9BACT|nr:YqcI/YcgG family protein [Marivirga sp. BDSF4-3]WKK74781.2 YqcI/YcgG family protein [Marivirga sp. BDSF4-3]
MKPQIKIPAAFQVYQEFQELILTRDHPCVMTQSSFKSNQVDLFAHDTIGVDKSSKTLLEDLKHYIELYDFTASDYRSFLAVFPKEEIDSEGMHPKSLRIARRSLYPTIFFNFHLQFERLKERAVYREVRDKIHARDKELQ